MKTGQLTCFFEAKKLGIDNEYFCGVLSFRVQEILYTGRISRGKFFVLYCNSGISANCSELKRYFFIVAGGENQMTIIKERYNTRYEKARMKMMKMMKINKLKKYFMMGLCFFIAYVEWKCFTFSRYCFDRY
jgi:hypothetical protein